MNAMSKLPWWVWSVLSGLLLGLSQPTLIPGLHTAPVDGVGVLALVGLVPALLAMHGQSTKRSYAIGFVTSITHFGFVLHWLLYTLHDYGGLPWLASVPILLLLAAAMAAYTATAYAITTIIHRRTGAPTWLLFPWALTTVEYLRNHGPVGGFPWAAIGHSLATVPPLLASAALWGVFGLTFLCAVVNAAIAVHLQDRRLHVGALALSAMVLIAAGGWWLLRPATTTLVQAKVALIQPNDNDALTTLNREPPREKVARYTAMQQRAVDQGAQLVVWPEASFPTGQRVGDPQFLKLIGPGQTAPPASVVGASAYGNGPDGPRRYNSQFFVDDKLNVLGTYHKSHIVPFGEYVPWPLGGIVRQFIPVGALTPMDEIVPTTMTVAGVPLSIGGSVCYEVLFPEITRELAQRGAQLFVNGTDDRWYGRSAMTRQHLMMNVLRAVENGRTILRATNTGISAWVDPDGGIHDETAMYTEALVVTDVPIALRDTPYTGIGDVIPWLGLCVLLPLWLLAMLPRQRRPLPVAAMIVAGMGVAVVGMGLVQWRSGWLAPGSLPEARSTQALLMVVLGLVVTMGIVSERLWGRRSLIVVAALMPLFITFAVLMKAWASIVAFVAVVVIVMVAWRSLRAVPVRPRP
jgi:apolipoprotein N-acyltransferase